MREAPVETHLRDEVKAIGGRAVKLNPLGWVGIPDRLVILPGGVLAFIELKRPKNGRVAKAQSTWHAWLAERGHWVEVLKDKGEVDDFMERARARMGD